MKNNNMKTAIYCLLLHYLYPKQKFITHQEIQDFSTIFINIEHIEPSYIWDNNKLRKGTKQELENIYANIGIEDLEKADISNQDLLIFVNQTLVCTLLFGKDLVLSLESLNPLKPAIQPIFKAFDNDTNQALVDQYNKIRESDFMKKMREQYLEKLQSNKISLSDVITEMSSLENKQITGWDDFCHFFAHIAKLIYNVLSLGEYKSTKDDKEKYNAELNELSNKGLQEWTAFSKEYIENVNKGLNKQC